jgi:HAD superfamily hydrolase (TIGR01509 family)
MPKSRRSTISEGKPAFLFDLDGTLIDSVYQHVLAWREALHEMDIELSTWRIHRRVGMSDGLILTALQRETGRKLSKKDADRLKDLHNQAFHKRLTKLSVPWAIATSGGIENASKAVRMLDAGENVRLITRNDVAHGKPFPDLFLTAAQKLGVDINDCIVVGDSVWDLLASRRAHALGVGILAGGYGLDELVQGGAYRVYEDPAELMRHVDELGVQADV